eukprot:comp13033_c0_seq1/m.8302 comp13033_c0_seq1/g.8302  ORF comp13033_c0_seq1/g.8302 comp13033_c0_seq1/m.8302 type:complete len:122 (-) comp13033_c0_seq1:341-706(-)
MSTAFIGDGKYARAGGVPLQLLWDHLPWREIKGCPGRYVTSDQKARLTSPDALLKEVGIEAVTQTCTPNPQRDTVVVARFEGGGGLLTYVKGQGVYVHTLNTASGMERKLEALGITISTSL